MSTFDSCSDHISRENTDRRSWRPLGKIWREIPDPDSHAWWSCPEKRAKAWGFTVCLSKQRSLKTEHERCLLPVAATDDVERTSASVCHMPRGEADYEMSTCVSLDLSCLESYLYCCFQIIFKYDFSPWSQNVCDSISYLLFLDFSVWRHVLGYLIW